MSGIRKLKGGLMDEDLDERDAMYRDTLYIHTWSFIAAQMEGRPVVDQCVVYASESEPHVHILDKGAFVNPRNVLIFQPDEEVAFEAYEIGEPLGMKVIRGEFEEIYLECRRRAGLMFFETGSPAPERVGQLRHIITQVLDTRALLAVFIPKPTEEELDHAVAYMKRVHTYDYEGKALEKAFTRGGVEEVNYLLNAVGMNGLPEDVFTALSEKSRTLSINGLVDMYHPAVHASIEAKRRDSPWVLYARALRETVWDEIGMAYRIGVQGIIYSEVISAGVLLFDVTRFGSSKQAQKQRKTAAQLVMRLFNIDTSIDQKEETKNHGTISNAVRRRFADLHELQCNALRREAGLGVELHAPEDVAGLGDDEVHRGGSGPRSPHR
jgi:hypothetical protein